MKPLAMIAAAALTVCAGTAFAACPDQSASNGTDMNKTAGISKDGTHAPLETAQQSGNANNSVAKDGGTMPLASEEGGGNKNLATSQQDVEAQQQGDQTAAAKADDTCKD